MIKKDNFIITMGWMLTDLHLSGIELQIYAIIYGFSQDGQTQFTGSLSYLMDWTGKSKPTILKNLSSLVEKGLIIKEDKFINNIKFCSYRANMNIFNGGKETLPVVKNNLTGSKETLPGVVKKLNQGGKETLPNSIDYNIEDNIYIKKISFSSDFLNYYDLYLKEFDNNEEKKLKLSKKWNKLSNNKKEKAKKDLAEFSDFWRIYDKKVDKENAFSKFCKTTDEERKEIFRTLPDFVASTPEKKYRKNPATYLYNKVWKNEIIKIETKNNYYGQKNSSPMAQALTTNPDDYGESTI